MACRQPTRFAYPPPSSSSSLLPPNRFRHSTYTRANFTPSSLLPSFLPSVRLLSSNVCGGKRINLCAISFYSGRFPLEIGGENSLVRSLSLFFSFSLRGKSGNDDKDESNGKLLLINSRSEVGEWSARVSFDTRLRRCLFLSHDTVRFNDKTRRRCGSGRR